MMEPLVIAEMQHEGFQPDCKEAVTDHSPKAGLPGDQYHWKEQGKEDQPDTFFVAVFLRVNEALDQFALDQCREEYRKDQRQ